MEEGMLILLRVPYKIMNAIWSLKPLKDSETCTDTVSPFHLYKTYLGLVHLLMKNRNIFDNGLNMP
jgi:hypothetical protein